MLVKDSENVAIYMLRIEIENTGHITNTYILKDKSTNNLLVIDPAYGGENILNVLKQIDGKLQAIVITHSHADHIAGLADMVNGSDVKVYIHELDEEGLYDKLLNEEEIVKTKVKKVEESNVVKVTDKYKICLGNIVLEIMHTPGHTKGSIILFNKEENILFSGDTIFENTYGRTDLAASRPENMKETLDKLFNEFENIQVFPGHGEGFDIEKSKRKIRLLFAFKERK